MHVVHVDVDRDPASRTPEELRARRTSGEVERQQRVGEVVHHRWPSPGKQLEELPQHVRALAFLAQPVQ
eukprot:6049660-Heterocapsa_arctica.AAC.1